MSSFLITGASSGIGAATALQLDRDGHRVFAGVEPGEIGPAALAGASGRLQRVTLDVTDQESISVAIEAIGEQLGTAGLDGVVNNAGIAVPGPLEVVALDDLRRQLEVNVVGPVAVTQAVLPLVRAGHGRVIIVSSIGGRIASQFAGPYYASKHAIEAVGEALRQELDEEDIPVVLIEPGVISTPIWDKGVAQIDDLLARLDADQQARYGARLRSFRESIENADEHGSAPEDVADAIVEALTTDKPDTRVVVGGDGKLLTALRPLIPDRIADKLGEQTAKP